MVKAKKIIKSLKHFLRGCVLAVVNLLQNKFANCDTTFHFHELSQVYTNNYSGAKLNLVGFFIMDLQQGLAS